MKLLRNPYINGAVIFAISLLYGAVLILTSGHVEFQRILDHGATLNSTFWNSWSEFLRAGNLKYIGYIYIVAALCVVVLSFARKKDYDEYQAGIFGKSLIITGIALLMLFPAAFLALLSDAGYSVEIITFLVVVHWSFFLTADLIYTAKWFNS